MKNTEHGKPCDFNNIKEWLTGKLAERKLSTSRLTLRTGNRITSASVFRWYSDTFRPCVEKMDLVCKTLSRLPILKEGEPTRYEEVPLWEGMAQFSERRRKDQKD